VTHLGDIAAFVVPVFVVGAAIMGLVRGVDIFGTFVEGVADGLRLMVTMAPYMIAVIAGVTVFEDSGLLKALSDLLGPVLHVVGLPAPLLPIFLVRPLSGSASFGLVAHILSTYGPDSRAGIIASTIQGSSETTLYVFALYLGAISVKRGLWALPVCLFGDAVGFAAAVFYSHLLVHP